MGRIAILLTVIILTIQVQASAQLKRGGELYSISYTKADFEAENQNFCAVKDKRGIMYFGNASGVLTFDGTNWNIIKNSTNSSARALAIDTATNTIYVGGRGDIGVLEINKAGAYKYKSLVEKIPESVSNFAFVQNIVIDPNEGVVFVTQSGIYILKDDKFTVYSATGNNAFIYGYQVDGHVYVVHNPVGIMELKNGQLDTLTHLQEAGSAIPFIDKANGRLAIANIDKGMFFYDGDSLYKPKIPIKSDIIHDIRCFSKTRDGQYYLLGTMWHGLIVTDLNFNIIRREQINGSISSIYVDENNLVWITTNNNGIVMLDLYSPFTWYSNSETGIVGPIRSVVQVRDEVYIGADAIFHVKRDSIYSKQFEEMKNPKGRYSIWKLDTIQGLVIASGTLGLSSIDSSNTLRYIDG
ncbi:MAG: hypothetical protein K6F33_11970, partial [Bacteroidales bacterium]|nr:hypothetical protein [Bacteroidales bacterium]